MSRRRNECYPVAPAVGWEPSAEECAARREAVDFRNTMIGEGGAARAVAAAPGASIGAAKKEAKGK